MQISQTLILLLHGCWMFGILTDFASDTIVAHIMASGFTNRFDLIDFCLFQVIVKDAHRVNVLLRL